MDIAGIRLGGAEAQDLEDLLESAVEVAKDADAVIAVVGLNADWCGQSSVTIWNCSDASRTIRESEGYDRTTLDLPGRTNELIQRIAEVNPKTIVVTQSVSLRATTIANFFLLRSLITV
jgi:beta-glucosidase